MTRPKSFITNSAPVRNTLILGMAVILISIFGATRGSARAPKLLPDLVVKTAAPPTANAGDNIGPLIHVRATNIGTAPAPGTAGTIDRPHGFVIDVVLSTDTSVPPGAATFSPNFSEDVLLKGGRISSTTDLAAGASKSYPSLQGGSGTIPTDTPAGTYFICARIDSGNQVVELSEGNNVGCSRIKIGSSGKPDLVTRLTVPMTALSGSDIGASVKLIAYNIGTAAAPGTSGVLDPANGYMIDLVLSTDVVVPPGPATYSPHFSEDVLLQGGRRSNTIDLAAGANKPYATGAGIPADTPTGLYRICARIDPYNKVAELNEANNVTCAKIKIKHP
jgi:hypothetical protein